MALERRIHLIIGKSGFGKTYLMRILLAKLLRAIVIDQRGEYEGNPFDDFNALADFCSSRPFFRAAWRGGYDFADAVFCLGLALGNLAVVVEEADLLECVGYYREAVYRGRLPARCSIFGLAQRPHLLSPDIRSQATDVWAFNNSEPSATVWLRSVFGDRSAELAFLPPKRGLHFTLSDSGPVVEDFTLP